MKKILIIDDENEMLISLKKVFSHRADLNVTFLDNPRIGKEIIENENFDLIISDLKMKDVTGMDILKAATAHQPDTPVIMISGYGTIEASVEAIKLGAFDFIEKPFTSKKLFECIDKAIEFKSDREPEETDSENIKSFNGIIYASKAIKNILELIKKVAPGNMNILITGESGTGKELFARAIHRLSKSSRDPFVPVNCGALPENLFESELFGYEKGAFTGAIKTKPGLLEFANNGTFFLDEISELTPALQVKLLRMLEEKKIRRIGGQNEIDIDVRIISATNRNLKKAIKNNLFREDLFYRISTIQIEIPPLRERIDDIIPLANHFLKNICKKEDVPLPKFSPEAKNALISYSWPGNIRELQNIIGHTFYLCSGDIIHGKDLPIPALSNTQNTNQEFLQMSYKDAKQQVLEKFEVEYLTYHLKNNKGNISRTAEQCGIDRRTIHRLIKDYNIIY